jgi:hypothetical protein
MAHKISKGPVQPALRTVDQVNARLRFLPLDEITKPALDTIEAAHYLNRQPKTLRAWANGQRGAPIQPTRIHGRLAWSVSGIRRLLGVE